MFKKAASVAFSTFLALQPAVLGVVALTACPPQIPANQVSSKAIVAFAGAVAALEAVDIILSEHIAALPDTVSDEQFEWYHLQKDRVKLLRDSLAITRGWLEGETDEKHGRDSLRESVALLQLITEDLDRVGIKIPDTVRQGIQTAALFV